VNDLSLIITWHLIGFILMTLLSGKTVEPTTPGRGRSNSKGDPCDSKSGASRVYKTGKEG